MRQRPVRHHEMRDARALWVNCQPLCWHGECAHVRRRSFECAADTLTLPPILRQRRRRRHQVCQWDTYACGASTYRKIGRVRQRRTERRHRLVAVNRQLVRTAMRADDGKYICMAPGWWGVTRERVCACANWCVKEILCVLQTFKVRCCVKFAQQSIR